MTTTSVVLHTEGLTKTHGAGDAMITALDGLTVSFGKGRFAAVMGPSGSGKSTLLHCIAALDRPDSGQVWLGETRLSALADKALTRLRRDRLGFVFQAFNLLPTLTAWENIVLPLQLAGRRVDPAVSEPLIDALELRDRLHHFPAQLSGGQQQRVACIRALITRPEIVFADEPTGSLDSRSSARVMATLRRSVDDLGQSVVMVTHDPVAAGYADRVLFLADGRVVDDIESPSADTIHARMRSLAAPAGVR